MPRDHISVFSDKLRFQHIVNYDENILKVIGAYAAQPGAMQN